MPRKKGQQHYAHLDPAVESKGPPAFDQLDPWWPLVPGPPQLQPEVE